jgi:hypothetical protein
MFVVRHETAMTIELAAGKFDFVLIACWLFSIIDSNGPTAHIADDSKLELS